jgi:hypothetical protein
MKSAFHPLATKQRTQFYVGFVPQADIDSLFNYVVGTACGGLQNCGVRILDSELIEGVFDHDLAPRRFRTFYEEFEIFPLGRGKRDSKSGPLTLNPGTKDQVDALAPLVGVHPNNGRESTTSHFQFDHHGSSPSRI